jgi:ubiquinone/menaquinone biosynthesis C-methylase UbiE
MDHRGDIAHFTMVDQHTDPSFFVHFLDTGSTVADIQQVRQMMRAQLALHDGLRVLDVGCGTGEALLPLPQMVSPHGHVVGVDRSGTMIAEATRRHAPTRLPVTFLVGDAHHLAFAAATFDRCRTERTLLHLDDPTRALAELVRVVRPGGHVVVFDFDWDVTFIDHPDTQRTRWPCQLNEKSLPAAFIVRKAEGIEVKKIEVIVQEEN